MNRMLRVGVGALAVLVLLGACAKKDDGREDLRAVLDRTSVLSHRFVFSQQAGGRDVVVRGLVEDDFRFKARVTLDGTDVLDQVIVDDAMVLRFLDPSLLPNFIVETETDEPSAIEALALSRWVMDDDGAPPVGSGAVEDRVRGADPVVDSLTMLEYVELAMADADSVTVFNPESVFYREDEDPFPQPVDGSGVERYDLLPRPFPNADARGSDGAPVVPGVAQFRKMAVYVRDGVVVQIRERVAAEGKQLEDLRGYVERLVDDQSPTLVEQFDGTVDELDGEALATFLLDFLNIGLDQAGRDPVTFRSMAFELVNIGQTLSVDMPDDVFEGDLGFFGVNDRVERPTVDESGDDDPSDGAAVVPADAAESG